jgi:glucosamine kinase
MQDLFIGVDGGGTKTKAIIENTQGELLGMGSAGPGNIRTSVTQSWDSVRTAINQAAVKAEIDLNDYRVHVGLGMAGSEFSPALHDFLATSHAYQTLLLKSDAHIACLGAHAGQDGAIIIIGTGVIGYQILQGQIYCTGGYGFPHADEGGGAWLGMELLRYTFKAIDKRAPWTPVLEHTFVHFGQNKQKLIDYANAAKPSDYAKLAPFIFKFKEEDLLAKNLLLKAAQEAEAIFTGLQAQSGQENFPLCLLGGIAPELTEFMHAPLQKNLVTRKFAASEGAIIMIKQHLGLWPTQAIRTY